MPASDPARKLTVPTHRRAHTKVMDQSETQWEYLQDTVPAMVITGVFWPDHPERTRGLGFHTTRGKTAIFIDAGTDRLGMISNVDPRRASHEGTILEQLIREVAVNPNWPEPRC